MSIEEFKKEVVTTVPAWRVSCCRCGKVISESEGAPLAATEPPWISAVPSSDDGPAARHSYAHVCPACEKTLRRIFDEAGPIRAAKVSDEEPGEVEA